MIKREGSLRKQVVQDHMDPNGETKADHEEPEREDSWIEIESQVSQPLAQWFDPEVQYSLSVLAFYRPRNLLLLQLLRCGHN